MKRIAILLLLTFISLSLHFAAYADWPMSRHDPRRTATASSTPASITQPAPYWRYYLGGSLHRRGYLAMDVNKDGKVEVVYAAGGKVIAKLPDDTMVWESPTLEIHTLVGVDDLDGDGELDVVAFSSRKAFVLSGKTGAIEWEEAEGEMGTLSGIRMGDMSGDGRPDLFIQESGCGGVNSGSPGVAYTFAAGFAKATAPLWTAPTRSFCGDYSNALGDFDGDGKLDLSVSSFSNGAMMIRGTDGTLLGTSAVLGTRTDYIFCDTANLDGRAGEELVCYQSYYTARDLTEGGHQVFALSYDASAQPPVKTLMQHRLPNIVTDKLVWVGNSLSDLDADGKWEVTVSEVTAGVWKTKIYDPTGDTQLAEIPDRVLKAIVDLDGDGRPELLAASTGSSDLFAYTFRRAPSPVVTPLWSLPGGYSVLDQEDWTKARRNSTDSRPLAIDLDGDKALELVLLAPAKDGALANLTAFKWKAANEPPTALASFPIPEGVPLLTHEIFAGVNRSYDQLLVTRSDGFLVILDNNLQPTNLVEDAEFSIPGMRVGGLYSGPYGVGQVPIAPKSPSGGDAIVVRDSRGYLLKLDPKSTSLITPPKVEWSIPDASFPTAVENLDEGKIGLACSKDGLSAYSLEGKKLWNRPLAGSVLLFDALPGDVNGDAVPDLFTDQTDTTSGLATFQVYNGKTGDPLWASGYSEPPQWGTLPFAVADRDADGKADLWAVINTLKVFRGNDGAVLFTDPTFIGYFIPTIADVDFDGADEVTLSGGYYPARTLDGDLKTPLWTGPDDRPYAFGARVECPSQRSVWVQPSLQTPGLVRLTTMNGAAAGTSTFLLLAEGEAFADAAAAKGKRPGTVGNVTIKPDLTGPSTHASALMGSTDGWLYALDPCAAKLDWKHNFRFPVGEAILADTSGDGIDEIVLTVADGYLYGLSQQLIAAPAYVYDTDPPNGVTDEDVDALSTPSTLHGKWAAVDGADSYEVAVVTPGGTFVTQPNWKPAGSVTSISMSGLPLIDGRKYVFAVRAVSNTKGASVEAFSDGVTVTLTAPKPFPDGGVSADGGRSDGSLNKNIGTTTSGCGCQVTSMADAAGSCLLFGVLLVLSLGTRGRRSRFKSYLFVTRRM